MRCSRGKRRTNRKKRERERERERIFGRKITRDAVSYLISRAKRENVRERMFARLIKTV